MFPVATGYITFPVHVVHNMYRKLHDSIQDSSHFLLFAALLNIMFHMFFHHYVKSHVFCSAGVS